MWQVRMRHVKRSCGDVNMKNARGALSAVTRASSTVRREPELERGGVALCVACTQTRVKTTNQAFIQSQFHPFSVSFQTYRLAITYTGEHRKSQFTIQ